MTWKAWLCVAIAVLLWGMIVAGIVWWWQRWQQSPARRARIIRNLRSGKI
jgi:hypothetical protein